jgi:hypothetical protein
MFVFRSQHKGCHAWLMAQISLWHVGYVDLPPMPCIHVFLRDIIFCFNSYYLRNVPLTILTSYQNPKTHPDHKVENREMSGVRCQVSGLLRTLQTASGKFCEIRVDRGVLYSFFNFATSIEFMFMNLEYKFVSEKLIALEMSKWALEKQYFFVLR